MVSVKENRFSWFNVIHGRIISTELCVGCVVGGFVVGVGLVPTDCSPTQKSVVGLSAREMS